MATEDKEQPLRLGVSLSTKYCRELGLDYHTVMRAALDDLGIRQFRLMSYWDELEPQPGKFNFTDLDWQFEQCVKTGAVVSLAIGMRQPRWPECHLPEWAQKLPRRRRNIALLKFVGAVVQRYKNHPALRSYQLENEAFNRGIGLCTDFDWRRLRAEFKLVKHLDKSHPIIMSTSDSWGIPLALPRPDIVGFSIYHTQNQHGRQNISRRPPLFYKLRAAIIRTLLRRPVIVHELQAEPWGERATKDLSREEQQYLMNDKQLLANVTYAIESGFDYIDLWGVEWWYWFRERYGDASLWETAQQIYTGNRS